MTPTSRGQSGIVYVAALVWDVLCVAATLGVGLYIVIEYASFIDSTGRLTFDWAVVGITLIVIMLEATRRALGWPLVILALLFIGYAHWGRHFPLVVAHGGASWSDIIEFAFRDSSGIFGIAVGVMASYVALFIVMGGILERAGASDLLLDLAKRVAGQAVGGPAKVAVVASSLMATISGSAVANVVTTGAFTIPLMKKTGLRPHVAAAIEAVASTGGIIMPPVMGAAAFIAAQNAGLPYSGFIVAAFIPAALYYVALFLFVDLEGRKANAAKLSASEMRSYREIAAEGWWVPIPFSILIYLLFTGYSPARSAGFGLLALAICVLLTRGLREGTRILFAGLALGTRSTAALMMAAATAGIVIAMIYVSGLGFRFTYVVLQIGDGSLIVSLLLISAITVILGMGLPITAAYLTAATLAVPVLTSLEVGKVSAHLFVLYFSAISAITPPVALASFAAAGIAGTGLWRTSFYGMKIGFVGYVVPFLFVLSPALLILDTSFSATVIALLQAGLALVAFATALAGHLKVRLPWVDRACLLLAGGLIGFVEVHWLQGAGVLIMLVAVVRNLGIPHRRGA